MSDRFNALKIQPPPEMRRNALAGPPQPDWAGATDENVRLYNDWLARDRQRQIELGYVDPATGQLTPEGWRAQAQIIGGGFGPADIGAVGNALGTIKAYHGSPHSFDAFDMSKIGTGEGAQAYGHGLYFAENEGVARGYRDALGARSQDLTNPETLAAWMYHKHFGDRGAATQELQSALQGAEQYPKSYKPGDKERFTAALDRLQGGAEIPPQPGHMYEVNLNAEPDQMLHWDKPISEQSPQVQDAAYKALTDRGFDKTLANYILNNKTGADLHAALTRGEYRPDLAHANEGAADAATALRAAGIPGISYLDAGSRGAGQGTMNHVMFDANTIDILRKYGIAGLMAGGAATAFGGQDQGNQ